MSGATMRGGVQLLVTVWLEHSGVFYAVCLDSNHLTAPKVGQIIWVGQQRQPYEVLRVAEIHPFIYEVQVQQAASSQ